MDKYKVIYDENAFGITKESLKMLRNALSERVNHNIAVVECATDAYCCGFLVIDGDIQEAVFTGDGFRTDGGGEGGAGYKSAEALFHIFGIKVLYGDVLDIWSAVASRKIAVVLERFVEEAIENFEADDYAKPADRDPGYLR